MLSFDEARAYLDSLAEELPRAFYRDLNGGVLLLPREKMSPEALAEDLYTLGEYQLIGSAFRARRADCPALELWAKFDTCFNSSGSG